MTGLSDIFEKILITVFQSGFRRGRSTLDHLIRFESFIRETFIKSEHRIAVFFYFKKAYNTTCIEVRYFERLALFSIKINNIVYNLVLKGHCMLMTFSSATQQGTSVPLKDS